MAERRVRDAERSREAILHAAEQLFAEKGFEGTSLQEIGEQAGVSRGTPGYFFGAKEQLYGAVLERVLQAERDATMVAVAALPTINEQPGALIDAAVRSHIDFLVARPSFLRLMEREALRSGAGLAQTQSYLAVVQTGMALIEAAQASGSMPGVDAKQLLLSIIALCWLPFTHANTLLRAVGLDATDPAFIEQRKQHIVDLVLRGVLRTG